MNKRPTTTQYFLLINFLLFSIQSFAFDILKHFPDFHEKSAIYTGLQQKGIDEKFGENGRIDELNNLIINAVDDKNKTASDYFILGNMFFGSNLSLSISYMKKAEKLSKNNAAIMYERAIQEHANKDCEVALMYYQAFFKTDMGKEHGIAHARASECYLRTKRYKGAVDSWIKADHASNHIAIDKTIHEMYGGEPFYSKRNKLLQKIIKNKNLSLFPDLIAMDLEWKIDWWNIDVNQKHLDHDLKLAKQMLNKETYEQLELMQHFVKKDLDQKDLLEKLEKTGLWSKTSKLPESPIFMYKLVFYLVKQGLVTSSQLSDRFEGELRKRVFGELKHTKNLDILAFIYSETDKEKLKELDQLGWKKYHIVNYARSLLEGETDVKKYKLLFEKIVVEFPYDPDFAMKKYVASTDDSEKTDLMANMVIGEFKNVQNLYDSYRLKGYVYSLAKQINHPSYTKTLND